MFRVLRWGPSDAFDWQKFPSHPLVAAAVPRPFPPSDHPLADGDLAAIAGVDDWQAFLRESQIQAFVVVHEGRLAYQGYASGGGADGIVISFSVAKSFTSALIGIAIDEGAVGSIHDPITDYPPELAERDARFGEVTIEDLLRMASGLEDKELRFPCLNSDDPLTTYYPDQRWLAQNNTHIAEPPGLHFSYNKYHPQLLGLILKRATGTSVTSFLQSRLWSPMGMEYAGSWSTDSLASDFEKLETGVNARALDFAKFGQLFLDRGVVGGRQLIAAEWVAGSTEPWEPADPIEYYQGVFGDRAELGYCGYMWWGQHTAGDYVFRAAGDRGQ